jgi:hypothetical protein
VSILGANGTQQIRTYQVGQIVRSGNGVFFRCHTESTGDNPDTDVDNDFWTQLEDVQLNPEGDIVVTRLR